MTRWCDTAGIVTRDENVFPRKRTDVEGKKRQIRRLESSSYSSYSLAFLECVRRAGV